MGYGAGKNYDNSLCQLRSTGPVRYCETELPLSELWRRYRNRDSVKKAPGVSKSYENIAGAGAPGQSDDRLRVSKLWGTGDCEGTRGNRNLYFLSV